MHLNTSIGTQTHKVELMQTQTNAVERMHADVERRILLALRIGTSICNREKAGFRMLQLEVLV